MSRDPYEVLGIPPDASDMTVWRAYMRSIKKCEREMKRDPSAHQVHANLISAYKLLYDHDRRRRYNADHGLPDPPARGRDRKSNGFFDQLDILPEDWPVLLPYFLWFVLPTILWVGFLFFSGDDRVIGWLVWYSLGALVVALARLTEGR